MTPYSDPLFRKLDCIPGAPNFVRYNHEELARTLKAYVQFAKGMPTVSYADGVTIIKDLVLGIIGSAQANKAADRLKDSPSREAVIEFVRAFGRYSDTRLYEATLGYADFATSFQIGRGLYVPVKPTLVARENGQFKPIFVFGWKTVPLSRFQRRLLMTILEDAIFSLTDFSDANAEIVFLPENKEGVRVPEVWHRGDYELLSDIELRNQMEVFLSARDAAYPIIADWLAAKKGIQPTTEPRKDDPNQPSLNL